MAILDPVWAPSEAFVLKVIPLVALERPEAF